MARTAPAAGAVLALCVGLAVFGLTRDSGTETRFGASAASSRQPAPAALHWKPVRGAVFYNVIFWRNGVRALDLWPRTAQARVPEGRLSPGRYQWFVYPALGTRGSHRYGAVAARGTLKI